MPEPSIEIRYFEMLLGNEFYFSFEEMPQPESEDFQFLLRIYIGEVGYNDEYQFEITVLCGSGMNSKDLLDKWKKAGVKFLYVPEYDASDIQQRLEARVRKCDAGTYDRSLPCLRRVFRWEYEGMK